MCVFQSTCTRCVKKCSDKEAAKTAMRKREGAIRERRNSELLNGVCTQPSVRGALNPFKFRTIALFLKSFRAECFLHPVEQAQKSNTASENTNSSSTRRADLFVCLERQHYPPGKTRLHRAAYRFSLHVFISLLMGAFYGVVVFVQNARKVSLTAWPVG